MKKTKYPLRAPEEQVKACVAKDFFSAHDTTNFIGHIDFTVAENAPGEPPVRTYLLWAEAKKGDRHDIDESFVQLVLTIGREKTHEHHLPPRFLGAFDAARIAFLPYEKIMDVFSMNDFNWNVPPSNHDTREFRLLRKRVADILASEKLLFDFLADESELRRFIRQNFARHAQPGVAQIRITKNNFTHVYNKWRAAVKPSINFTAWEAARKNGIIDADFFLADLLSEGDETITGNLNILLKSDRYRQTAGKNNFGQELFTEIGFTDGQCAHRDFWRLYRRPPQEEYWDYIVNRRDLLVPQDIREVKGAFFTPSRWVELSQEYLARALGENWQDEYVVWDCCAGTGNLLAGLTNKKNLWASTLDQADVNVMLQRIQNMNKGLASGENGANLFPSHVFRFDFLNDSFDTLPEGLRSIVNNSEKRKKLVVYINPPYKEATSAKQKTHTGGNIKGLTKGTPRYEEYKHEIGLAARELFAQFFYRIYKEIPGCILGEFSTPKHLQAPNFAEFRLRFRAKLGNAFLVPADTFDNVQGQFPIGFFVWRLEDKPLPSIFSSTEVDVYDRDSTPLAIKRICAPAEGRLVINWLRQFYDKNNERVAYLCMVGTDVQHSGNVFISSKLSPNDEIKHTYTVITRHNVIPCSVYMAIRHCIAPTWLNNRDHFLYPSDTWKEDSRFQMNCLVWAVFDNVIKSADGPNHWVPFPEEEIGTKDEIKSHFMIDLLAGKGEKRHVQGDLFDTEKGASRKPVLSSEARAVLEAAKTLYHYYHSTPGANPDASFYDIRLHFQKTDERGRMNPTSADETYNTLLAALRAAQKPLAARIAEAVYRHGFLK